MCKASNLGNVIVYADDVLIITRTRLALQNLFSIVETEIVSVNLELNVSKGSCIRIGPRFDKFCIPISSLSGSVNNWSSEIKYLGVYIRQASKFSCATDNAKRGFNRACNSIFGKLLGKASEEVILHMIKF